MALATPMLVSHPHSHKSNHLQLVQTSSKEEAKPEKPKEDAKAPEGEDDNPCHGELTKIFDDKTIVEAPADVLLNFVNDFCVEAADDFLPSKCYICKIYLYRSLCYRPEKSVFPRIKNNGGTGWHIINSF